MQNSLRSNYKFSIKIYWIRRNFILFSAKLSSASFYRLHDNRAVNFWVKLSLNSQLLLQNQRRLPYPSVEAPTERVKLWELIMRFCGCLNFIWLSGLFVRTDHTKHFEIQVVGNLSYKSSPETDFIPKPCVETLPPSKWRKWILVDRDDCAVW